MEQEKYRLKPRGKLTLIGLLLFAACLMIVFYAPLFGPKALFTPDGSPYYLRDNRQYVAASFTGTWAFVGLGTSGASMFHPSKALAAILPPLQYHIWGYVLDTVLIFLAGCYLMSALRMKGPARWLPPLALAFSGYAFTLISAGHRGMFDMIPYAVFIFGLLENGIRRRSLYHFAMIGVCTAFGMAAQPDVFSLYAGLAAIYGLYRLLVFWPPAAERMKTLLKLAAGAVLAIVVAVLVCMSTILQAKGIVNVREQQMAASNQNKWEFCTNWSMPPEEFLEFVAPAPFGFETQDPRGPYWGRLGRSLGWNPQAPNGLVNLRQHTVYMGAIQTLFGLLAIVLAVQYLAGRRRGRAAGHAGASQPNPAADTAATAALSAPTTDGAETTAIARDTIFWAVVYLLTALLALGRYFPLYHAFFLLPGVDKFRCPVKLLHLTELANVVLFAYGLTAWSTYAGRAGADDAKGKTPANTAVPPSAVLRRFWLVPAVLGAVLLVLLFAASAAGGPLVRYWHSLGLGAATETIKDRLDGALWHGIALCAFTGTLMWLSFARRKPANKVVLAAVLAGVLALDLVSVARPYIRLGDVSPWYQPNPMAQAMTEASPQPFRASFNLGPRSWRNWVYGNFASCGVNMAEPAADTRLSADDREYLAALQGNVGRLWELTGTRFVIGQTKQLASLAQNPAFKVFGYFGIDGTRFQYLGPRMGPFAIYQFANAMPRAQVYHAWRVLSAEDALKALTTPQFNPHRELLVTADDGTVPAAAGGDPSPAVVEQYHYNRVVVAAESGTDGILLLNDKFDPRWRAAVDGKPTNILRCNYLVRGIFLPAGKHTVVFTYRPLLPAFLSGIGVCALLLAWSLVRGLRRERAASSD